MVERNRPYDTFGWGVVLLRPDARQPDGRRPGPTARAIVDAFNHWDDIDVHLQGPHDHARAATASAASGASACSTSCRSAARRSASSWCSRRDVTTTRRWRSQFGADLVIASDGLNSRIRQRYAATFQPDVDLRRCRFVWLGTQQAVRRLHVRVRGDASTAGSRRTPTSSTPRPRPSSSRRPRKCGARRPRPMAQAGGDRVLRAPVRALSRRPRADEQRRAPARLGDLDPLSARRLPALDALDRDRRPRGAGRADGRRGAHRALLGRLGHQARARGRDRARPARSQRGGDGIDAALAAYEARAQRRGAEDPERRAQLDRMVRERRALQRHARPSSSPTAC